MPRKRDLILQFVAIALAFAVGILVGARGCSTTDEPDVVTQTIVRECPSNIVYECPPDVGVADEQEPVEEVEPLPAEAKKKLPDAPPPITPRQRQRLLAWVRDQSADLDGCRTAQKATFRLAVTLSLDDDGTVERVSLNAPKRELPSNVRTCLRQRMMAWQPPAELVGARPSLMFGLTL